MNKKIKKVFMYIFSMTIVMMTPCLVSAHSLTPWAALYTPERAGGNFQFSIGDFYHPPTNYVDYYFENSVARNNFLYSFIKQRGLYSLLCLYRFIFEFMPLVFRPWHKQYSGNLLRPEIWENRKHRHGELRFPISFCLQIE